MDVKKTLKRLFRSDEGATAIEYGLIVALVAIGSMVAFSNFGTATSNMWNNTGNTFAGIVNN